MAIRSFDKIFTNDEGSTDSVVCKACNEQVSMRLFSTSDHTPVALLKGDDKNRYIAVCPNCAAVYNINKNYLKEKKSGTTVFVTQSDLTPVNGNDE